jgi:hypothetical protein
MRQDTKTYSSLKKRGLCIQGVCAQTLAGELAVLLAKKQIS